MLQAQRQIGFITRGISVLKALTKYRVIPTTPKDTTILQSLAWSGL